VLLTALTHKVYQSLLFLSAYHSLSWPPPSIPCCLPPKMNNQQLEKGCAAQLQQPLPHPEKAVDPQAVGSGQANNSPTAAVEDEHTAATVGTYASELCIGATEPGPETSSPTGDNSGPGSPSGAQSSGDALSSELKATDDARSFEDTQPPEPNVTDDVQSSEDPKSSGDTLSSDLKATDDARYFEAAQPPEPKVTDNVQPFKDALSSELKATDDAPSFEDTQLPESKVTNDSQSSEDAQSPKPEAKGDDNSNGHQDDGNPSTQTNLSQSDSQDTTDNLSLDHEATQQSEPRLQLLETINDNRPVNQRMQDKIITPSSSLAGHDCNSPRPLSRDEDRIFDDTITDSSHGSQTRWAFAHMGARFENL
jgi:hypothetical protein